LVWFGFDASSRDPGADRARGEKAGLARVND
jgi:hypothetical protein